jgi:hypothetical protein
MLEASLGHIILHVSRNEGALKDMLLEDRTQRRQALNRRKKIPTFATFTHTVTAHHTGISNMDAAELASYVGFRSSAGKSLTHDIDDKVS